MGKKKPPPPPKPKQPKKGSIADKLTKIFGVK